MVSGGLLPVRGLKSGAFHARSVSRTPGAITSTPYWHWQRRFNFNRSIMSASSRPPFNPEPAHRWTQYPDESWKLGEGLKSTTEIARRWKEDENAGWKTVDLDEMEKAAVYKLLISAVVPRPIAFVSSLSGTGEGNLAPFSYFSLVSHNPPLISVSFTIPTNRPKDTRENIKTTKEFCVNIMSEPFVEAANSTSIEAPADINEWGVSGLTPVPSELIKPPRVLESAVSFECELFHIIDFSPDGVDVGEPTGTTVLGRIRRVHIRNSVLTPDGNEIDITALRAVSRLGGSSYARVGDGFDIARPSWRAEGEKARELSDAFEGKSKI